MSIASIEKIIEIKKPLNFDLNETLNCGQCFRFKPCSDGCYEGVAKSKYIKLGLSDDEKYIRFFGIKKSDLSNIWEDYFDLNTDYSAIAKQLASISPLMQKAIEFAPGIRILKQDAFEALCSFIISQNNNIPRISKIISKLCETYGDICENNIRFHAFPSAQTISKLKPEELRALGCGFRDKYLLDAASKIVSGEINLCEISKMPLDKAKKELQKIKGVGPKVADCVLLYGMHRLECFPEDVWIKRAMKTLFPGKNHEIFGEYAGIAQQYIYHYSRKNPGIFAIKL